MTDSFTFYTYTFSDDLKNTARRFYESAEATRRDLVAFRTSLIKEQGTREPLRDMKIVRLKTRAVTRRALIDLFNAMDGDLGGFIESREVVGIIKEPQIT